MNLSKGGSARAASADAATAAAEREAENRARDQRHRDRNRARNYQNNNPQPEQSNAYPKPGNPFPKGPEPKWNPPKPPRKPKPREEIYLQPHYRPSGRQPPWSIRSRPPVAESSMPWGNKPFPIGSKNPFSRNVLTGQEIPAHGHFPLNPGYHCSPKIDAAWPIVHNEGYRVLRGCSDLYKNQWKDVVAEAANIDIKSDPELEEGLRRIEYMFHKFAEYVWGLLTELPRNMVALIDPDAAMDKLESVMFTLQEFCNRGQRLPMAMGFLAQGVRGVLELSDDPEQRIYDQQGRAAVLGQLREMYEAFMGEQKEPSPGLEEEL